MKHIALLRSTAMACGAILALTALDACNKSNSGAGAESSDFAGQNPNGYAPTGDTAQAGPTSGGGSGGGGYQGSGGGGSQGGGGGYYASAGYYVDQPPPPIPEYDQPPPPSDGYYWTPGYWAWSDSDEDYYWVPGTWVEPPNPDLYWTPGYWAYVDGGYAFYRGYWGPVVGYYGGVDYGWGYNGRGYFGGRWQNNQFYYNSAANNFNNVHVANVYRQDAPNWTSNRTSYSGGPHGLMVAPTPQQVSAARARHVAPTSMQAQHVALAQRDPTLRANANHGRPPIVATASPTAFQGPGVVSQVKAAGHYNPPAQIHAAATPQAAVARGHGGPAGAGAPTGETRGPNRPAETPATAGPQGHGAPANRPVETAPAARTEFRGAPPNRPAATPATARPEFHGAPPNRPAETRAASAPAARAQVRAAPAPRPEVRSAPAPRPEVRSAPAPRPEAHAAPPPAPRPEARAAPPPRAAPAPRPAPAPQERKPDDHPRR